MILDTDILSALSSPHRREQLIEALERASGSVSTTAVNWAEVCYGVARMPGKEGERIKRRYEELVLPRIAILDFDRKSAEVYANIRSELERRGERLADADMMIASIALCHNMTLVTGNTRHFARIPGLKLENWLEG